MIARTLVCLVGVCLVAGLLAACEPAPPPDAITAARATISAHPDDSAPRIALARLHLAEGRGDLAAILLDQAEARGAVAKALAAERAEALHLMGKTAELLALPLPEEPAMRLQVLVTRAKSAPTDANFLAIYEALDVHDDATIRGWIDDEPAAARAKAHHDCVDDVPEARSVTLPPSPTDGAIVVTTVRELQQAARTAPDGALIEITAGAYPGGVATWHQSGLTVRGIGGRPHITAQGKSVEDRDVWLFTGDDVIVEGVEMSGARSPRYRNGASIRFVGANLTLRNVYLHDSENGLLTGGRRPESHILIEHSEFARNGDGEGFAHNIYIGYSAEFSLRFSHSHASNVGHLVKSRAARTTIAYNRLADDEEGRSSRTVDLPDAGEAIVIGNVIDHGASSENHAIIGYGTESKRYTHNTLHVVHNTVYNRYLHAIGVDNWSETPALLVNNLFAGAPLVRLKGPGRLEGNLDGVAHGLTNPRAGDVSLSVGAYEKCGL